MNRGDLQRLKVLAFTHKQLPFELVGKLHIDPTNRKEKLSALKSELGLSELMYLSTCNRVEFVFVENEQSVDAERVLKSLDFDLNHEELDHAIQYVESHSSDDTVKHLFKVSASLDSMVIGEREIITQVRKAFEECYDMGLTGDLIRLVMRKTIETAKTVFTETAVFRKPVSVVSLAFHNLRDLNIPINSRVCMIGAGKTNRAMAKFLVKHGYENIVIFNRTLARAEELASDIGAKVYRLDKLPDYKDGFDVLITCTSSEDPIVTSALFEKLKAGETSRKVIIDLAIPGDVHPEIIQDEQNIRLINISELKNIAEKNLKERAKEIDKCEEIIDHNLIAFHDLYKQREIEIAMRGIPQKVKEIRQMAVNEVYAKELQELNPESLEVLNKIVSYMEKKYISVPMKMAKEVILGQVQK